MFRRVGLPPCPSKLFEQMHALEDMDLFIDENDKLRSNAKPTEKFESKISSDDQLNLTYREVLRGMLRREVNQRGSALGFRHYYFPGASTIRPNGPHVRIIANDLIQLRARKHVFVIVNEESQDLGIFAYRTLSGVDGGLDRGSWIGFAKELMSRSASSATKAVATVNWAENLHAAEHHADLQEPSELNKKSTKDQERQNHEDSSQTGRTDLMPAVVVLNPGQLIYSHELNESMTRSSWFSRPRPSGAHPTHAITEYNIVPGHDTPTAHTHSIFQWLQEVTSPDAKLYMICMQQGGDVVLEVLNNCWSSFGTQRGLQAIALMDPKPFDELSVIDTELKTFLAQRGRGWLLSPAPALEVVSAPPASLVPVLSAGDDFSRESVFEKTYNTVIDWFEEIALAGNGYRNPTDWKIWEPLRSPALDAQEGSEATDVAAERIPKSPSASPSSHRDIGLHDEKTLQQSDVTCIKTSGGRPSPPFPAEQQEETGREQHQGKCDEQYLEDRVEIAGTKVAKSLLEKAGLSITRKTAS